MSLTPAERHHIVDWISTRCPAFACAACGGRRFEVDDEIIPPMNCSGKVLPLVPVACKDCGYVALFSLRIMQLLPAKA